MGDKGGKKDKAKSKKQRDKKQKDKSREQQEKQKPSMGATFTIAPLLPCMGARL